MQCCQVTRRWVKIAATIKEKWISDEKPSFAIIHWDSKMISHLTSGNCERVAVLFSGGNQIATPKLLGIPTAPDATGKSQKDEVVKLLRDWKLEQNLIGIVFDTTASNTGVRSGCAVLLEKEFNKPLLWLACRHCTLGTLGML